MNKIIHNDDFCDIKIVDNKNYLTVLDIKKKIPSDEEWDNLLKSISVFYEYCKINNKKFSLLLNFEKIGIISKTKLNKFYDIINKNNKEDGEILLLSVSIVVENKVIKNLIKATMCFIKLTAPVKVFGVFDKALKYSIEKNI